MGDTRGMLAAGVLLKRVPVPEQYLGEITLLAF
jgi:hypothetical protein